MRPKGTTTSLIKQRSDETWLRLFLKYGNAAHATPMEVDTMCIRGSLYTPVIVVAVTNHSTPLFRNSDFYLQFNNPNILHIYEVTVTTMTTMTKIRAY